MSAKILEALFTVEAALVRAGVPGLSPFWRAECERFYRHPTARVLVACVGRGGDKSRTSTMMAIAETLAFEEPIAPGEQHFFTHVSENIPEAAKTVKILEQYLRIVGVPFLRSGDTINLEHVPRGFKVLASRIGAVSGWRCIGWTADEAAKWDNGGVDPAHEVITSLRSMTITHPSARGREFSSPMATDGQFFEVWSAGDTASTLTCRAATWEANPSVTKEHVRSLYTSEAIFLREGAAIPGAGVSSAIDAADARAMVRSLSPGATSIGRAIAVTDASSGAHDPWVTMIAQTVSEQGFGLPYVEEDRVVTDHRGVPSTMRVPKYDSLGRQVQNPDYSPFPRTVFVIHSVLAFEGEFRASLTFDEIVQRIAEHSLRAGVERMWGDQYLAFANTAAFSRHSLRFEGLPTSASSLVESVGMLRQLLHDRTIVMAPGPEAEKTVAELMALREIILPSGQMTIRSRRTSTSHGDRASCLLLLARLIAGADGSVPGSPIATVGGFSSYDVYGPNP